jgi:pimeloyl-ACP methyl ester carboxylesterase
MLFMMTSAPLVQHRQAPTRDKADSIITRYVESRFEATDANDMLYYFDASRDYDPSPYLARVTAPVLAINSADDQVNPPELGLMERLILSGEEREVCPAANQRSDAWARDAFPTRGLGRVPESVPGGIRRTLTAGPADVTPM